MKVEELRIGNYVKNGLGEICQVRSLLWGDVVVVWNTTKDTEEEIIADKVYPIEITVDLLIQNGFKQKGECGAQVFESPYYTLYGHPCRLWLALQKHKGGWEIQSLRSDRFDRSNYVGLINYVHEMQNYLNLAKHGLEVELC